MASDKVQQHIENALDKIRVIFIKAAEKIDSQKPGDRIRATHLAEEIGQEFGITGAQLYPTLQFLYDNFPNTKRYRGAHGGIQKLEEKSEAVNNIIGDTNEAQ
jgi:hypothetical protein